MATATQPCRVIYVKEIVHPRFILWNKPEVCDRGSSDLFARLFFNAGLIMVGSAMMLFGLFRILLLLFR